MKTGSITLVGTCLITLAACTDTARDPEAAARTAVDTITRADTHGPVDTMVPIDSPIVADKPQLLLNGEGLRIILLPMGTTRPIPFGRSMESVLTTVGTLLDGSERTALQENADCNATAATWPTHNLTLWFASTPSRAAKRFVGWSMSGTGNNADRISYPRLTTASGLGVGSTRADLLDAYNARIQQSSLGVEFSAGGLAGLLASNATDARVTNLWSGQVCLAR